MAKYTKKRVDKICQLIESDDYTLKEVCNHVSIGVSTFFDWKNNFPEFLEAIKKAEERRLDTIKQAARSGLLTLLRGKEWEEMTTELIEGSDGKPKIKKQTKVKKFIMPNPTSVIFALKNLDEDNFADLTRTELSGPNGGPIQMEQITGMEIK